MSKKDKNIISTCQERHIDGSNCYTCAFGYPLSNPRMCLFGLREDYYKDEDKAMSPSPKCDRYIHKERFEKHLNGMLGIDSALIDDINEKHGFTRYTTVKIPKDLTKEVVDMLRKKGYTISQIRYAFDLHPTEVFEVE